MQKKSFRFGKKVCIGSTLNVGICSIFWGNFEGILGNPGEIPHIGRKTLGVYRVNLKWVVNYRYLPISSTNTMYSNNPKILAPTPSQ